ncbi:MAG: FHA domain-containing protein [Sedimentisphaerales bacterium]|jgi:pSer/pThr/pTyr-binding forkhead associated (FHA) protein|nr:FHA domain-containing protein [Sedimentisphaerales bacterium]HNY78123.1 FHA domain-containing protein [Sedimentisphaerales bacterium]HOC62197.1 FHA domain-containing protein [Sedimentisphaerales bacterium]HOH63161.1 FHA domain-containing protein [Sedimentisphaerales bacterium]HPY51317.1 FHA domain-containing protein [Sedimentisphaerales bacterium]
MRLVLRQKDGESKEYQFAQGPIEIGRGADNHVFLPDRTVSKKHAVIVCDGDGRWEVQDLGSANKTYLNGEVVAKAPIKTGDAIRITDFTLEVSLDERPPDSSAQFEDTLNLEAGLATPLHETVVRKPDAGHAPAMRLAAKRLSDFSYACDAICKATNLEELLVALLNVTVQQFSAFHTWCALREQPSGPMTYHTGKRRDGKPVELGDLMLADKINQAVERAQSLVLPRVAADLESKERIRSALIAAICGPGGCYGVIYVDNAMIHDHYTLGDLDYLMLIAMHTAAVLKRFVV